MQSSLTPFFEPRGVAIVGASDKPDKLSHGILKNLVEQGYQGGIYPVNPKSDAILGKKCFADVAAVPDPVDLAVIILPAPAIPGVLEACGQRGIRAVTVISGGFKEIGEQGKALEAEIIAVVKKHGMRMIGPNCVGTVNLVTGLNTTFIKGKPATGGIGLISQSGAVCGGIVDHVLEKGVGFSHILSLGNMADVSETDMLEYLGDDPDTRVIAIYAEGVQDGKRFLEVGRQVTRKKPVLVLKAGRSDEGAKAVSSHTGSLAGSHAAYQAAFQQSGMIEVQNTAELLNVAMAMDWLKPVRGKRAAIITNAGGPAALASDSMAEHGIQLAELSTQTQARLREKLNPAAQAANPVDMLGGATETEYAHALECALADEGVDMALAILVPTSLVDPVKVASVMADAALKCDKPVLACLMGAMSVQTARQELHSRKVPMIDLPEQSGVIFGALHKYAEQQSKSAQRRQDIQIEKDTTSAGAIMAGTDLKVWGEHLTRPLLAAYGVSLVQGQLAADEAEVRKVAAELGYPLVLKVASQDVLHKSDYGAIAVNIQDEVELTEAYVRILANVKGHVPQARIDGVLVEKMAPKGLEVILGMKRDPGFGPLLMFGLGGIFVELFKDVSFRVAPLSKEDAREMLTATKAYQLLTGWRGGERYDLEAILQNLLRLSQLALDYPHIQEVEINPLLVLPEGQGALALDCRMILA